MVRDEILKEYEASFHTSSWITMVLALVLVNTEIGREKEVLGWLRAFPSVRYAYEVYGVYDIVLKVEVESRSALQQVVTDIRSVPGVRSTLTLNVISE
jgi:DNA-binding Lrp family transcriptional regulator